MFGWSSWKFIFISSNTVLRKMLDFNYVEEILIPIYSRKHFFPSCKHFCMLIGLFIANNWTFWNIAANHHFINYLLNIFIQYEYISVRWIKKHLKVLLLRCYLKFHYFLEKKNMSILVLSLLWCDLNLFLADVRQHRAIQTGVCYTH